MKAAMSRACVPTFTETIPNNESGGKVNKLWPLFPGFVQGTM